MGVRANAQRGPERGQRLKAEAGESAGISQHRKDQKEKRAKKCQSCSGRSVNIFRGSLPSGKHSCSMFEPFIDNS